MSTVSGQMLSREFRSSHNRFRGTLQFSPSTARELSDRRRGPAGADLIRVGVD
jgi:hypothetical protein